MLLSGLVLILGPRLASALRRSGRPDSRQPAVAHRPLEGVAYLELLGDADSPTALREAL
ncbi:hypothetical protein [Nocardia altamirensis]|uniref:hypothetical protein n=1 Tax=Nocardia altamirensis TaxID=472158 RepID=UPI0014355F22|nr:hypothetical protein [Nocardia altamirensis]